MKILRVFPRRTRATPTDALAVCRYPRLEDYQENYDAIHISVAFTQDIPEAKLLALAWNSVASVQMGGPAFGKPGGDFTPGLYLKPGYVITSRGCPNQCWFCKVWKREGMQVRELPITEGWNVLDDNLLACSQKHVLNVMDMLRRQKHRVVFTGGIEARRVEDWSAEALRSVKPDQLFMAYDEPADWDPLVTAVEKLFKAGFPKKKHCIRAYVLCGYPKDTFPAAEQRMIDCLKIGITPAAMLWQNDKGYKDPAWGFFQRRWFRQAIIHSKKKGTKK